MSKHKTILSLVTALALGSNALAGGGQPTPASQPVLAPATTTEVIAAQDMQAEVAPTDLTLPALSVPLYNADGSHGGMVRFTQGAKGVRVQLSASGLSAGEHGFHIHAVGSCENTVEDGETKVFGAAGGHFDPAETGNHAGPDTSSFFGHAGDMPNVTADAQGNVAADFTTDKFSLSGIFDIHGKSVILHKMGDDYHTNPAGNAGARALCGVIE